MLGPMGRFSAGGWARCTPASGGCVTMADKALILKYFGAGYRIRTCDPLITNQVHYQLC
jgi:hypothetical protein